MTAQPKIPRLEASRDDLTDIGRIALDRAILELERRCCTNSTNSTEKITGADVVLTDDELVATLLDPRTVSCHHLSPAQRKRALIVYVVKYVEFARTAVNRTYIRNPLISSPQKPSSVPSKKGSKIASGITFESGG